MIHVIKANGEIQPFDEKKLLYSAKRSGVPEPLQEELIRNVKKRLYNNIPTREIYSYILENLDKSPQPFIKARYTLKQAIMLLGPTGYPFEDFISELMLSKGYKTKVRQILTGKCVSHEVDVIAERAGKRIMIEAKFHNNPGTRSDVHVSLYTKARFEDIRTKHHLDEAWVITNTKTTTDAIAFATCSGMKIISWSFPDGGSLRDLIEESGLHPITVLSSISNYQKQQLLENHIILCRDLCKNPEMLDLLHLPPEQKKRILDEAAFLCNLEH